MASKNPSWKTQGSDKSVPTMSTVSAAPAEQVVMSGSLWKERSTWLKHGIPMGNYYRFRLRFFALSHGRAGGMGPHLRSWKDETRYRQKQEPDKIIFLSGCSLSCAQKHTGQSESFGLFHPERDEVFLLCPDRNQYLQWMEALEGTLINPEALKLNDFNIVTMVGAGSFGQVFQVRKKDTNQVFALKVLDKSHLRKIDQVQNTKQERRVLEIVNHPFIVKLHYAFQTGPALCLVMDFINGGELFMHLRKHRFFSEADARIWAAEILLALEYLHSMSIIYRDIKPENVLLDSEGHIKLTDFGLAREASDQTTAKEVAGSPYYMAPEVLLMQGHDVQADWWSLGILIYEMIVGLPPFYSKDTKAAYQRLLTEPLQFKDHVSQAARELIKGLLNTDPNKRLGAVPKDRSKQSNSDSHTTSMLSQAWGDGMPIKMQAWFKGLRWDAVLLRQVKPSLVPQLKDAMDVSNFDQVFTGDRSWKHSNLLRNSIVSIDTTEDPFADFHYVSRPSMDRKMRDGMGGARNAGSRPTGRGPPVRYDVMDKGRMSIDQFRDKQRLSSEMSTDDAIQERRRSSSTADTASAIYSIADGTGSLDGDEQVGNPCSPWHPCDNGHTDKSIRGKRLSAEAALSGVRESAERSSMDGVGQHSSDDEQLEEGDNSHHSSHMTKQKIRSYRCNIPIAKEGFLESAKKAVVAATVLSNKKRYVSSKRSYMRLIPSLGCLVKFKSETSVVPTKVIAVPSADKIYPKHGIIHIGNKVHVYSIRVLMKQKEYTLICDSELERDDWVEQLRTVGEHWKHSCMRHLQLCGVVKTWKTMGFFKKFTSKLTSDPTDRFLWQANLMGGTTLEMMSFLGADREGPFRYDGCVDATSTGAKVAGHERHGRGLCQWKMTFAEKEDEREKSRTIMRHAYYDGFWDRSAKNGQAMVKFADDSVFEGAYKKPTGLQGYGRMAYSNGSWYEGSWHHGLKHGYGYMWWSATNEAHQGNFAHDVAHGHGIRYYPSGDVYQGGWLQGAKHGLGVVESQAPTEIEEHLLAECGTPTPPGMPRPSSTDAMATKPFLAIKTNVLRNAHSNSMSWSSRLPKSNSISGSMSGSGWSSPLARASSTRRVTSHAHFQLEVTDDELSEDDLSHASSHPPEAAELEKDLSARRVVRQDSNSSLKGAHNLERRPVSSAHSTSSLKGTHNSTSSLKGTHQLERRASVARLESAGYTSSSELNAPKAACRLVMSRCIDGVPLDELACQMAQMATVCDTSLDDATAPDMRDSEFVSEVELEWQDVLRCEADLDNAAAEYYDCGDYQSGIPSPDMTPKNTPVHSPDFSFRMTWDDGNARTSDDGNARGVTRGCVSGGAALGARPMSTALSRGQLGSMLNLLAAAQAEEEVAGHDDDSLPSPAWLAKPQKQMSGLRLEEGGEAESGSGARLEQSGQSGDLSTRLDHSSARLDNSSPLPSPAMTLSSGPVSLLSKPLSKVGGT